MKILSFLKSKFYILFKRNKTTINGEKYKRNDINIEYCYSKRHNFGDTLSPYIFHYLKSKFRLGEIKKGKGKHILMCGSIIAFGDFDAIIWGSGFLDLNYSKKLSLKKYIKYDIKAIRGPLTRNELLKYYNNVPEIYGDPGILIPLIYPHKKPQKKYKISVISHYADGFKINKKYHYIDIFCNNLEEIIDEILSSEMVVSSSLHGIIVSESFGVPTVWLKSSNLNEFKYLDWYYSTGRNLKDIVITSSLDGIENLEVTNPPKAKIAKMQKDLINAFPFELWS